jgi:hypothetical protein
MSPFNSVRDAPSISLSNERSLFGRRVSLSRRLVYRKNGSVTLVLEKKEKLLPLERRPIGRERKRALSLFKWTAFPGQSASPFHAQ